MRPRWMSVLAAAAVVASVAVAAPAAASSRPVTSPAATSPAATSPGTAAAAAPPGSPVTITLITGDRVTVYPGDRVSTEPGPGRTGTRFLSERVQEHLYVFPADAVTPLRSGRLDRRLFDMTLLRTLGYDDRAAELPLLMAYPDDRPPTSGPTTSGPPTSSNPAPGRPAPGRPSGRPTSGSPAPARSTADRSAAARSAAAAVGARVVRDLPLVGAVAMRADRDARTALWNALTAPGNALTAPGNVTAAPGNALTAPGNDRIAGPADIGTIWLDGRRTINLDTSVPQIGATEAWRVGLDGTGTRVAVLDTGIDATHPDLAGRIAATRNFTADSDDDTVGHGTHVASTIAGSGAASGGRYRGVAPGATLLDGKVCVGDDCAESAILAGLQWSVQQGARIVNLSLGSADTPGTDPLERAIDELSARYGTLFVVAAGNRGARDPVNSPASADAALAVGAVDGADRLASFSSRGLRPGAADIKPELTAPGVDIVAARAAHGEDGDPAPVDGYTTMSGTSMAAPHVTGAAAILSQQHPDWTGQQIKTALMAAAAPRNGSAVAGQGAGRVDIARAIAQSVAVDDGGVNFGRQRWPHGDDTPSSRVVTYRNDGPVAVTLSLTLRGIGPDGRAPAAGFFDVDRDTLTIPAGGTAQATLTTDTRLAGPDGLYSGYLVGTAPGVRVELPFAVDREAESYDVTLVHTDRNGKPAADAATTLLNLDTFERLEVDGSAGTTTVRLPRGNYGLVSQLSTGRRTPGTTDDTATLLAQPKLVVDADRTVALDARRGRRISVRVSRRDAVPTLLGITLQWSNAKGSASLGASADRLIGQYVAQIGPTAPADGFLASIAVSLARPGTGAQPFRNSPYTYDLAWFVHGRMFTGLYRRPGFFDLAAVHATYTGGVADAEGVEGVTGTLPDSGGWMSTLPFDLPFRRTKYVNTDGGVGWESIFTEQLPAPDGAEPRTISTLTQSRTVYRPGHSYRQLWTSAVQAGTD